MERKYKVLSVFAAVLISAAMLGGCDLFSGFGSGGNDTQSSVTVSDAESSEESEESQESAEESSDESSEEESSEESTDESTEEEESSELSDDTQTEESSEEESVEESSESSVEESSMDESQAANVVVDGYQFDDEEIVTDYHNPKTFTSNEEFNKLFVANALDAAYNEAQKGADSSTEMLNITSIYALKWKDMADTAYNNLYSKLADYPSEQSKLVDSQEKWQTGIEAQETLYEHEAQDGGTESLLVSQAELMNRYKSRAAVLFEQIYELDGTINLSAYGL
ncbi:MAG: DUF1311 domain-containing protein [Clostridia bacterium]|nr:DUF1311 domain-containing protein [Clostridia bacterium]